LVSAIHGGPFEGNRRGLVERRPSDPRGESESPGTRQLELGRDYPSGVVAAGQRGAEHRLQVARPTDEAGTGVILGKIDKMYMPAGRERSMEGPNLRLDSAHCFSGL
jgi:hypothetical protein